jgi:hypothetical protein
MLRRADAAVDVEDQESRCALRIGLTTTNGVRLNTPVRTYRPSPAFPELSLRAWTFGAASHLGQHGFGTESPAPVLSVSAASRFWAYLMLIVFEGAESETGWFQLVKVVRPVSRPVFVIWMG